MQKSMIEKRLKTREWKKKHTYICRNGNQIDWKHLPNLELSSGIVPISICVSFEHKTYQDVRHTFSHACSWILQHSWRIEWSWAGYASGNYKAHAHPRNSFIVPVYIEKNSYCYNEHRNKEHPWTRYISHDMSSTAPH